MKNSKRKNELESSLNLLRHQIRTGFLPEYSFENNCIKSDLQTVEICTNDDTIQKYLIHKTFTRKILKDHLQNSFGSFHFVDVSFGAVPSLITPSVVLTKLERIITQLLNSDQSSVVIHISTEDVLLTPTLSAILLEYPFVYCFEHTLATSANLDLSNIKNNLSFVPLNVYEVSFLSTENKQSNFKFSAPKSLDSLQNTTNYLSTLYNTRLSSQSYWSSVSISTEEITLNTVAL